MLSGLSFQCSLLDWRWNPWFQIQKGVSWTTLAVHPAGTETFIAILWEDSPSQEPSWIAATSPGSKKVYMKSHQSHLWTCFVSWVPPWYAKSAFSWLALISSIPSRFQVLKMISAWPLTGRMHQIRILAASENPWKTRGENLEQSRCSHGQPWPPHCWRSSLWGSKQVMGVWQWLKGRMVDWYMGILLVRICT